MLLNIIIEYFFSFDLSVIYVRYLLVDGLVRNGNLKRILCGILYKVECYKDHNKAVTMKRKRDTPLPSIKQSLKLHFFA